MELPYDAIRVALWVLFYCCGILTGMMIMMFIIYPPNMIRRAPKQDSKPVVHFPQRQQMH